jgi:hypothetical protein
MTSTALTANPSILAARPYFRIRIVAGSPSLPKSLQSLVYQLRNHLLQYREFAIRRPFKVSSYALLDVLADLVHLDVNVLARLLACRDHFLLCVGNQHDLPPTLRAVFHLCDCQAGSVYCNVALLDDISQHRGIAWLEAEGKRVAVGRYGLDGGNGIDVSLHEMAAHARVGRDSAL